VKEKIRKNIWTKIGTAIAILLIAGATVYLLLPHYFVLQKTRSLSITSGVNDFIMSPAKVHISIPIRGESLTIPVIIQNGTGETVFAIAEEEPSNFDNGYFAPDGNSGYRFTWNKNSLDVQSNTSGILYVRITRTSFKTQPNIEEGIAVSQTANGRGISVLRTYIFEVEN
jgi:hypothetical protein